jgi:hypothetical protein
MQSGSTSEYENASFKSVTGLEVTLFRGSLKRNIANKESRFYTLLPKYGVVGSTRLIVAKLWLLPAVFFLIVSVVLEVSLYANVAARIFSFIFFGFFLGSSAMMAIRAISSKQ